MNAGESALNEGPLETREVQALEYFTFAGFWVRVGAALIDGLILIVLLAWIPVSAQHWAVEHRSVLPDLAVIVFITTIYIICAMRFGGTPGKLILGIRIVDDEGRYLSLNRALRREFVASILFNFFYLLQLATAMYTYPETAPRATGEELSALVETYGEPFSTMTDGLIHLVWINILLVAFTRRKQALHDLFAGSYVVTRDSL